jgi:phosphopantothenoylcysteine synthetase/decarboxylase
MTRFMDTFNVLYLLVSGAATARRIPALIPQLQTVAPAIITVQTPNSHRIVSPRELALVPGHRMVDSYFDEVILPRPEEGVFLVAPCGFNTLNKLAQGIADNLPLSMAAEAIGRGTPVIVAVSVNPPLRSHPQTQRSIDTLRSWGVTVIDTVPDGNGYLTMAPDETLVAAVQEAFTLPKAS